MRKSGLKNSCSICDIIFRIIFKNGVYLCLFKVRYCPDMLSIFNIIFWSAHSRHFNRLFVEHSRPNTFNVNVFHALL